ALSRNADNIYTVIDNIITIYRDEIRGLLKALVLLKSEEVSYLTKNDKILASVYLTSDSLLRLKNVLNPALRNRNYGDNDSPLPYIDLPRAYSIARRSDTKYRNIPIYNNIRRRPKHAPIKVSVTYTIRIYIIPKATNPSTPPLIKVMVVYYNRVSLNNSSSKYLAIAVLIKLVSFYYWIDYRTKQDIRILAIQYSNRDSVPGRQPYTRRSRTFPLNKSYYSPEDATNYYTKEEYSSYIEYPPKEDPYTTATVDDSTIAYYAVYLDRDALLPDLLIIKSDRIYTTGPSIALFGYRKYTLVLVVGIRSRYLSSAFIQFNTFFRGVNNTVYIQIKIYLVENLKAKLLIRIEIPIAIYTKPYYTTQYVVYTAEYIVLPPRLIVRVPVRVQTSLLEDREYVFKGYYR
ncbi:hypothetical protein N7501_007171, partial [Penicillium viridicatum]